MRGLSEALANSAGVAHSMSDCVGYLEEAGFASVAAQEFIPDVLVRVTGNKPA